MTAPFVNDLNKYIWTRPEIITELSRAGARPYTSLGDANCPVTPFNEQPENDAPYVVYNYKIGAGKNFWLKEEDILYVIWDHDIARLQRIEHQLIRYLSRWDLSAESFIKWAVDGVHVVYNKPHKIYSIDSEYIESQEQEGGIVGRALVFRACYDPCKGLDDLDTSTPV